MAARFAAKQKASTEHKEKGKEKEKMSGRERKSINKLRGALLLTIVVIGAY